MDYVYVHDFFSCFCPCNWGTRKASGYCSQSERLLFGRDTRNLRRWFRRFVGRNRKSRRREAAGRRNYPEAVPNGEGENGSNAPRQVPSVPTRTGATGQKGDRPRGLRATGQQGANKNGSKTAGPGCGMTFLLG